MGQSKKSRLGGRLWVAVAWLPVQTAAMNHTDVMMRIVEMAKVGGALSPEDAIAHIAAMIDRLDMYSDSYERDMEVLVKIGATIWDLHSGPGGAYDPTWVPTFLRP